MKESETLLNETPKPVGSSVGLGYITVHGFRLERMADGEIVARPSTPAEQLMGVQSLIGAEPLKKPLSILLEAAVPENLPIGSNLRWVDRVGAVETSVGAAELAG